MTSKPERPQAWFSQSKQRQQMWQAAAAGVCVAVFLLNQYWGI